MVKRAKSSKSKVRAPRARAKPRVAARSHKRRRKAARRDPLDDFVDAAAGALDLPVAPAWRGAVKANLAVTFALAELFADFPLPDDAEPAPVFSA
jgi:Protein of unknown function (DUF4089)